MEKLEQLIRSNITLPTTVSAKGWYSIVCKVCDDHKKRAGFIFDGNNVGYSCFNCKHKAKFVAETNDLSVDMEQVLYAFGVPDKEIKKLKFELLRKQREGETPEQKKHEIQMYHLLKKRVIAKPDHFKRFVPDTDDTWTIIAQDYLEQRGFDPHDYDFYLSTGGSSREEKDWKGRLIIPFFREGELIFYQGRDLTGNKPNKYKSCSESADNVLYGFDNMAIKTDEPLFVTEGFFDAYPIKGVAIIGNEFTEAQLELLRRCPRKKVYVPDRFGDGHIAAKQAIEEGWGVSFIDSKNCKDISDACKAYGTLFVLKNLKDNIRYGTVAHMYVNTLCSKSKTTRKVRLPRSEKA